MKAGGVSGAGGEGEGSSTALNGGTSWPSAGENIWYSDIFVTSIVDANFRIVAYFILATIVSPRLQQVEPKTHQSLFLINLKIKRKTNMGNHKNIMNIPETNRMPEP